MLTFDLQRFATTITMTSSLSGTAYARGNENSSLSWVSSTSTGSGSYFGKYTYDAVAGTAIFAKNLSVTANALPTETWIQAGTKSSYSSPTAVQAGTGASLTLNSNGMAFAGSAKLLLAKDGGLKAVSGTVTVTSIGNSGLSLSAFSSTTTGVASALAGTGALKVIDTELTLYEATGKITKNSSVYTYTASGDADQFVKVGTGNTNFAIKMASGNDTVVTGNAKTTVDGGAGNDTILLQQHEKLVNGFSIAGGAGDDTIMTVASYTRGAALTGGIATLTGATIDGGAGDDRIDLDGVTKSAVSGGAGDDQIIVTGTNGKNTVMGGAGSDTITSSDATNIIYGNGGGTGDTAKDYFDARTSGNIDSGVTAPALNIADYESNYDVILVDDVSAVANYVAQASVTGGVFTLSGASITVGSSDGATSAIFQDGSKTQVISWDGGSSSNTDYSSATTPQLILASSSKTPYLGGSANDTIIAKADNISMYGAGGNDSLVVSGYNRAWVGVATNSGADTVVGFNDTAAGITSGFDGTLADQVSLVSGAASQVGASYDGNGNLTITDGSNARLTLASIAGSASDQASTTGAMEVMINNAKVAVAASTSGGTIQASSNDYANYYLGNGTGALSFASIEGEVGVNMEQGFAKGDAKYDADHFRDFATIVGGSVESTLIGATSADTTIQTTAGKSSVWGGNGGQNVFISNTASKDEIFMLTGSGRDTVVGFTTYSSTDPEHADVLNVLGSGFQAVHLTANGVLVDITDKDNILIQGTGTALTCNDMLAWKAGDTTGGIAKVGYENAANNFEFNTAVTQYIGGGQADTLTMVSDALDHFVWLDGDNFEQARGVGYAGIDVVDASATRGDLQLAGDKIQNVLIGGAGNASMWGGSGSGEDLLIGGTAVNTFFYGIGDGNDTIQGTDGGDLINLMNIDETSIDVTQTANALDSGSNAIYFTNGQALFVNATGDGIANFQLGNGHMYQLSGGKLNRTK